MISGHDSSLQSQTKYLHQQGDYSTGYGDGDKDKDLFSTANGPQQSVCQRGAAAATGKQTVSAEKKSSLGWPFNSKLHKMSQGEF